MKNRRLGSTQLKVSEIAFGGASIGNLYQSISNQDAQNTIHQAWEQGIRYFDTAPQYGHGLSEHRLGYVLREYPRNDFVISTKVGKKLIPSITDVTPEKSWFIDPLPFKIQHDYSYDGIMRHVEDSLHRLGMNKIDIIHIHDLDVKSLGDEFDHSFQQAMESGYLALDKLKNEKVIHAISLGVKEWQVCEAALQYGHFDCFMLQGSYTLLEQGAKHFLDSCFKRGLSIIQAGPFNSGVLATGSASVGMYHHQPAPKKVIDYIKKIESICAHYQVPLQAAAIQFPLRHPAVSSVAIGIHNVKQLQDNIAYYTTEISHEFWKAIDDLGALYYD